MISGSDSISAHPSTDRLSIVLLLLLIYTVLLLSARSIWLDEAMLLVNIYDMDIGSAFLRPLLYYDQASPMAASLIIKLAALIGGHDYQMVRLIISLICILSLAPLALELKKQRGVVAVAILLFCLLAGVYQVGYYFTEIKHYGFR